MALLRHIADLNLRLHDMLLFWLNLEQFRTYVSFVAYSHQ